MTTGQAVTESHAGRYGDDEVSDATAEKHDKALAVVQRLLSVRGVRSCLVHTISLKLFGDGRPYPLGQRRRLAPELVVTGSQGRRGATVSVGPRSGCYLVSLRNGPGPETVRDPHQVVDLILTARSGRRT
ncbi:hypothetical protein [Streptosporangium subroseum]|uniref:hypothetical protein n=1 Tax=Streptosporangium subroseum TaxID=106412 RepID=UPI00308F12D0|nr:hypothetical protein OHB15_38980 [Streptosporangium subroseum]